ncbi:nodulation protein NfeD [Glaciimonas sp. PCH181]|uniref:NfeD family protein n=1 Tax=Glaciimonas sp. PCH181 TaxID=2133943 RepID=UPI000D39514E|nr:nodulation protein NfeD [Glaciimonas sp. PCH181]PUA18792.1 serine protease [Glaciimonas sp. PCH181]
MLKLLKIMLGLSLGLTLQWASTVPVAPIAPVIGTVIRPVIVLPLEGAIGPATATFISRNIVRAQQKGAQLIVLRMDTPGGLDISMRQIIQTILASPIPVATFVAPGGARAASAGTFILYASHIAAMAPGTNLGAASPVQIGMPGQREPPQNPNKDTKADANKADKNASAPELPADNESTLSRKRMHDAAAYIRGLAQMRGRNAPWAERAVREAVSLSSEEALHQKVIDLTALDVPELLRKLDGRSISTSDGTHVLHTAGAPVTTLELDNRTRFLAIITDPSTALILLMIGVYGLIFEFSNPGFVLPGVAGAICLLIGLFALQMLPVNYAGLGLILLGIGFLAAEIYLPTFGVIGIGGIIAFSIGAMMLIDTDLPGYGIPLSLIVALAVVTALFIFFVSGAVLKSRRRPVVSGAEELLGSAGLMLSDTIINRQADGISNEGWARVHSEQWRVQSPVSLQQGQQVRVTARTGLILKVMPVGPKNAAQTGE